MAPRNISLLDKNPRALSDLELNQWLLVVKARLKQLGSVKHGLGIMYISSAGSRSRLLIAIRGIDIKFSQINQRKTVQVGCCNRPHKTLHNCYC